MLPMHVHTLHLRLPPPPSLPLCASQRPLRYDNKSTLSSSSLATKSNLLLAAAAKSRPLDETLNLFRVLPVRDTVTWNTAISAALRCRRPSTALALFLDMLVNGAAPPDSITIRSILSACSELHDFRLLTQLHACLFKITEIRDASEMNKITTSLINLYCDFGCFEAAEDMFDRMPHRDVVAFTSMISGYTESGISYEALVLVKEMVGCDEVELNEHAFSSALHACAVGNAWCLGKQMHACVIKLEIESNLFVGTSLVDLYAKCDDMNSAKKALVEISEPNVVSWNALLAGNLDGKECLMLFMQFLGSGLTPDHVTFANLLRACKEGVSSRSVQQVHCLVLKWLGSDLDEFVGTALFELYIDGGHFDEAEMSFREIKEKDHVAVNLAIQGFTRNGHHQEALSLFYEALATGTEVSEATMTNLLSMFKGLRQGKQLHSLVIKFGCGNGDTKFIFNPLIKMYAENQNSVDAIVLFGKIRSPDLISWTSVISILAQNDEHHKALELYFQMVAQGFVEPPNHFTFSSVLSSCGNIVALDEGKQIHAGIIKSDDLMVKSDPFVLNGLIYMYAKCGYIEEASKIFSQMQNPDLASWNVMISSLGEHGFAERAVAIFEELLKQKDLQPNHITYVGVLSVCAHFGLVEKAYEYFRMIEEPNINHYACLINLHARAGKMKEAMELVERMPFQANESIWSSLLAACNVHVNLEFAEYSAQRLLELNPKDPGIYVALSNVYAAAKRWKDVDRIRELLDSDGGVKYPGMSWLNLNRKKLMFKAGSKS